jgi:hypothetical protein
MSKMTDKQIEQGFRDAPRLDPSGQSRSNSGIADQEGGTSASKPGAPGARVYTGPSSDNLPMEVEHVGGFTDGQVPRGKLP